MSVLTNILYWLSTGMLVPVILLLLFCFFRSLALIGDMYGQYARRLRSSKSRGKLAAIAGMGAIRTTPWESLVHADCVLHQPIAALDACGWHAVHGEKVICDFEQGCRRSVDSAVLLMRVGPMLGLMGTLIPMGPALVGLAAGDIASMASNMQVAFSTTVLGLFVGAVGMVAQQVNRRWHRADSETLRYLMELALLEADQLAAMCKDGQEKQAEEEAA
jgi:biopolymer transport protein ExbB/TolQ